MSTAPVAAAAWIVDASVALKWFLSAEREPDAELARLAIGSLALRTTSLAFYEVGNILGRQGGWDAERVVSALGLLREICGDPLELTVADERTTAALARTHGLTFYDASYAAIAQRFGRRLLSADGELLAASLAVSLRDALAP